MALLVKNAVLDGEGTDCLIENGVFTAIAPGLEAPVGGEVLDAGGAAPQDIVLAGRVCGGEPMGRLVCGDLAEELHAPLEERGDLRVHFVDLFSDYFELLHILIHYQIAKIVFIFVKDKF